MGVSILGGYEASPDMKVTQPWDMFQEALNLNGIRCSLNINLNDKILIVIEAERGQRND